MPTTTQVPPLKSAKIPIRWLKPTEPSPTSQGISVGAASFVHQSLVEHALKAELKVLEGQSVYGRTDKLTQNIGNICNWGAGLIEDNFDVADRGQIEALHYEKIAAVQETALKKIVNVKNINTRGAA
jgi:hypothetical protein